VCVFFQSAMIRPFWLLWSWHVIILASRHLLPCSISASSSAQWQPQHLCWGFQAIQRLASLWSDLWYFSCLGMADLILQRQSRVACCDSYLLLHTESPILTGLKPDALMISQTLWVKSAFVGCLSQAISQDCNQSDTQGQGLIWKFSWGKFCFMWLWLTLQLMEDRLRVSVPSWLLAIGYPLLLATQPFPNCHLPAVKKRYKLRRYAHWERIC
jgi:hypothetical protein